MTQPGDMVLVRCRYVGRTAAGFHVVEAFDFGMPGAIPSTMVLSPGAPMLPNMHIPPDLNKEKTP